MIDETRALEEIRNAVMPPADRAEAYRRAAVLIREAGGYRSVGLFNVDGADAVRISWAGENEPAEVRGPLEAGTRAEAVRRRASAADPAGSRIATPILDSISGRPKGVIEALADRIEPEDRRFLERCAAILGAAISASPG